MGAEPGVRAPLFQPQDQIAVGEDGFKQWDGKDGWEPRAPCPSCPPSPADARSPRPQRWSLWTWRPC